MNLVKSKPGSERVAWASILTVEPIEAPSL
jgi:hypothetical protein